MCLGCGVIHLHHMHRSVVSPGNSLCHRLIRKQRKPCPRKCTFTFTPPCSSFKWALCSVHVWGWAAVFLSVCTPPILSVLALPAVILCKPLPPLPASCSLVIGCCVGWWLWFQAVMSLDRVPASCYRSAEASTPRTLHIGPNLSLIRTDHSAFRSCTITSLCCPRWDTICTCQQTVHVYIRGHYCSHNTFIFVIHNVEYVSW